MKSYILFFAALLSVSSLAAQQAGATEPTPPGPTAEQLLKTREIDIAAAVLEKVIRQQFDRADTFVNIEKIQGNYLSGVGALFNISHPMPFFNYNSMYFGQIKPRITGQAVSRVASAGAPSIASTKAAPGKQGAPAAASTQVVPGKQGAPSKKPGGTTISSDSQWIYTPAPAVRQGNQSGVYTISTASGDVFTAVVDDLRFRDSVFMDKLPEIKKAVGAFFANYAILLTKLGPEEKIGVNWVFEQQQWGLRDAGPACALSASVRKQDILDFRAGKLSADALEKRTQYNVTRCAQKTVNNMELEIFGAIFEKLYSEELSPSLIQLGPADYDAVQGFGFVINLNFSEQPYKNLAVIAGQKQTAKPSQTPDFQERLTLFKAQFPSQLIEYGRILKTLKPDEVLQVRINFPYRWGEEVKPGIVYTIPQTVLAAYDSGKTLLTEAVKAIRVEEKAN
jgi:hypothetical protein